MALSATGKLYHNLTPNPYLQQIRGDLELAAPTFPQCGELRLGLSIFQTNPLDLIML